MSDGEPLQNSAPREDYRNVAVVCTWAQDERPADLHMAQPNVPVSCTTVHHNTAHRHSSQL
jgi:hypothetical protein